MAFLTMGFGLHPVFLQVEAEGKEKQFNLHIPLPGRKESSESEIIFQQRK